MTILKAGSAQDQFGTGGGGVTDHGALTGLADDDHTQYTTTAEAVLYVEHGADANVARPTTSGPVVWIGSVVPNNIQTGDLVLDPDASGSLSATFQRRAYQSLTDKSSWGAINTREQWGTEEATVDDALLPSLTSVTAYASIRGGITTWTSNSLLRARVEISLDGGSTWDQGTDLWARNDGALTNDRLPFFVDHQVTGTVTGDIQARVMVETDIISPALVLTQGRLALEVSVTP